MERKQPNAPKKWHPQQEKILKSWGESSSCYRYLHFQSYLKYKKMSMKFTLPIIVFWFEISPDKLKILNNKILFLYNL